MARSSTKPPPTMTPTKNKNHASQFLLLPTKTERPAQKIRFPGSPPEAHKQIVTPPHVTKIKQSILKEGITDDDIRKIAPEKQERRRLMNTLLCKDLSTQENQKLLKALWLSILNDLENTQQPLDPEPDPFDEFDTPHPLPAATNPLMPCALQLNDTHVAMELHNSKRDLWTHQNLHSIILKRDGMYPHDDEDNKENDSKDDNEYTSYPTIYQDQSTTD